MSAYKQLVMEKLLAPPSKESLLNFISWLDLECVGAGVEAVPWQILTRSIVAAGRALVKKQHFASGHPVVLTLQAAEAYCQTPVPDQFALYFKAATRSYPFGSGEGCYAINECGFPGCQPGSGCPSGAGSLYSIARVVGSEVVWQAITAELIPWLKEGDEKQLRKKAGK
ncbi:MAG: hypothetical protein GYA15_11900 [Leptolinea sp.]|jgi:hypothetical protein|nr:hypothetical protein [Leptolinea sp.]